MPFETLKELLDHVKASMESWDSVPPEMEDGSGVVVAFSEKPAWSGLIGPAIRDMGYDVFTTESPVYGAAFYVEVFPNIPKLAAPPSSAALSVTCLRSFERG